jgi:hypothetical protein
MVTLTAAPNPSVFGAPVVLTANVTPPNATGRVTFYDGVTLLGSKPLSSGTASISTILLPAGSRKLTAYYSGDAANLAGTAGITQTVKSVAEVGFRSSVVSVAPASLTNLAVGDFNGDGKADLAMPGSLTGSGSVVTILLGNGDGTFQAPANYTVGFNPQMIVAADLNGDGTADIAVTATDNVNNGIISVLLGNGDGTFRPVVNFPAGAFSVLAVGDFNGDGKVDLVGMPASGAAIPTLIVLPGNGDGTFQAPLLSQFPQQHLGSPTGLVVADFNGDGKADIATISGFSADLIVALGNGDGTFQSPVNINNTVFLFSASSITAGDFNGDGKTDLAVGGTNQKVLLGNGDGTFKPPVSYPIAGNPTTVDFNGDGITDLAVAGTKNISILQSNGDGTFQLVLSYTTANDPFATAVADFNGDGRADIVVGNGSIGSPSNTVSILLGVTAGLSLTATAGAPQSTLTQAPFAVPLQVMVVRDGIPVSGAIVTFTAPSTGASAALSPTTAVTNPAGIASVTATANGVAGNYLVTATYQGLTASFALTNTTIASVVATSGTPQSTVAGTSFPKPLVVTVRDSAGNPASGASVTFLSPGSGAGATFLSGAIVLTNAAGQASALPLANAFAGSYTVIASAGGQSATFSLTNVKIASVIASGGTPQSAAVSTAFPSALSVTVRDSAGRPVSNVSVGFSAPSSGAGARLSSGANAGSSSSIFVSTNASGVASVTATANNTLGSYTVTASVGGLSASFSLTNLPAGSAGVTNLALGKIATQSSTFPGYSTAVAASAVDGNTDGNFFDGSVTATNPDMNAWWQVDLGASATVSSVVVWNRTDCCSSRLSDFWVFLSDTPFLPTDTPATLQNRAGTFASHQTPGPTLSTTITVTAPGDAGGLAAQGRYVRVQLAGTDYLSLAEVQVMGLGGAPQPTDLALGKAATQSSTFPGYASAGAGSAVDGSTDGNFFDGSVTATNADPNAWWQVDLGSSATVNAIVVWNRTDCCGTRLGDYWVFVSNTPFLRTDTPATLQNRAGTFASHQTAAPDPSTTITAGAQGRYVRVQLTGTDYLSLAEVQVFGVAPGITNLALGKSATQSSTFPGYPTAVAASAVDGNTDGNFFDGSVTATNLDANAWWQVDLGASASISSVVVWNRTDCCASRLSNFWVFVSDTPFAPNDTVDTLRNRPGTFGNSGSLTPNPPATITTLGAQGRYIRVQLAGTNYLSLAEVQVFGQ